MELIPLVLLYQLPMEVPPEPMWTRSELLHTVSHPNCYRSLCGSNTQQATGQKKSKPVRMEALSGGVGVGSSPQGEELLVLLPEAETTLSLVQTFWIIKGPNAFSVHSPTLIFFHPLHTGQGQRGWPLTTWLLDILWIGGTDSQPVGICCHESKNSVAPLSSGTLASTLRRFRPYEPRDSGPI